jgi:hypothetical protein
MRTHNEYMVYCKGDYCKGNKKIASFNYTGLKPKFCSNCKKPDMSNVVSIKCIICNLKRPKFNIPTESNGLYCGDCKKPDMIDVENKKCITCNLKRPYFNLPTESKGLYCSKCKLPDMIDVKHPKCITCKDKRPLFNLPTESNGLYCSNCKKPDMINVVSTKCINCNLKQPYFNLPTESRGLYCSNCKKPDMINVVSTKCINCNLKQPYFNLPTESRGLYCGDCKKPNMINVVSTKCINCKDKIPHFNLPTESNGLYCGDCKKPNMINVLNKKCIAEKCEQYSLKDNYCMRCYYFHNPSKKPKRLKVKEEEVINYLKQEFMDIEMITDKALIGDGLCLKNRPDVLIHLNKHSIIIEIDEEQHKWYNLICDEARINNIQEALNRPIIIIRFNPDSYTENGKKIKSCFNIDKKTGMRTIPKNQQQNWNNRLAKLKETLALSLENYTDEPIRIIKLFYDNV